MMKNLSENRPITFEIILFAAAVLLAGALAAVIKMSGLGDSVSSAAARILTGIILLIVFRKNFKPGSAFKGFAVMLPALLLAVYKIPYHFASGGGEPNKITLSIILIGLAPAVLEEILFRGIFIYNLKKKYNRPAVIVIVSAVMFSLVHLTNIGGMDAASLILQLIMAFAVGVVLGAVYLRTEDIVSVIIAHFAIDITGYIFCGGKSAPMYFLIIVAGLLLFEIIYGLILLRAERAYRES